MSIKIRYAYLSGQTWIYRRHYPKGVQVILGQLCFKQSLKTSDVKLARIRTTEINSRFEETIRKARVGVVDVEPEAPTVPDTLSPTASPEEIWLEASKATAAALRATLAGETVKLDPVVFLKPNAKEKQKTLGEAARIYLRKRARELRFMEGKLRLVRISLTAPRRALFWECFA